MHITTCLSDIGACVHIVSLKVIVGIRGLIEENTHMGKPELDSVSARWTAQTQYVYRCNVMVGVT